MTRFRLLAAALAAVALTPNLYANDLKPAAADRAPRIAAAPKLTSPAAPRIAEKTADPAPAPRLAAWVDTAPAPKAKAAEPAAGYVSPAAATVAVHVQLNPNTWDSGSGSVVWAEAGVSYIVTNKHVVAAKRGDNLTVRVNATGKTYPATFVDWSDAGDVAILSVPVELPAVALGSDPAAPTPTTHYGNKTGPQRGATTGYVTYSAQDGRWHGPVVRGTHYGASGDSGGAVVNDRGELVAVLWGGHPGDTCAAPVSVVRSLLRRVAGRAFPRLAARLADDEPAAAVAVNAAQTASTKSAGECPAGACPAGVCQPQTAAAAVLYRVGNGPLLTAEQFRQQYPQLAGVAGGVSSGSVQAGGSCPGGVCYPQTTSRRGVFR